MRDALLGAREAIEKEGEMMTKKTSDMKARIAFAILALATYACSKPVDHTSPARVNRPVPKPAPSPATAPTPPTVEPSTMVLGININDGGRKILLLQANPDMRRPWQGIVIRFGAYEYRQLGWWNEANWLCVHASRFKNREGQSLTVLPEHAGVIVFDATGHPVTQKALVVNAPAHNDSMCF
jgi:hypothetical protein